MKTLMMNPQKHDIVLIVDELIPSNGYAQVSFNFGEVEGQFNPSSIEAKRIGEWFLRLSKELKPKIESKVKTKAKK